MSKRDDSVGLYDHILLAEESQAYVGFEWDGWWFVMFVNKSLLFGWKKFPVNLSACRSFRNQLSSRRRCCLFHCILMIDR